MSLEIKYFILKPRAKSKEDPWAKASQDAMLKYAELIEETDPGLAGDLTTWAQREIIRQTRMEEK